MSSPAPYSADFAPEETTVSDRRKIDPQNIEAEKSVLAACMLNQEAIEEVAPKLVKENFYRIAHQRIYESMMDLYVRHIPIDHISLADNLKAMGQLEAVGGKAYLIELADNTFALTNWQNHLEIVKRTSILRDLIRARSRRWPMTPPTIWAWWWKRPRKHCSTSPRSACPRRSSAWTCC